MPGFAGSHDGYPRGGRENKIDRERLFVVVCETWCIEGKERSLGLLLSLVSLIMLQTDVVLALHTQSHTVSCTEVTVMNDAMLQKNMPVDLEMLLHLLNQTRCRRKLVENCKVDLKIIKCKCVGNHASVLICSSLKLFSHTSCLYVLYFVVICVSNLVSAGLHGGCLSCSPSCPNMVLCWL